MLYANDYDDTMALGGGVSYNATPPGGLLGTQYPLYANWFTSFAPLKGSYDITAGLLYPYMKSGAITDCPSASGLTNATGMEPVAYSLNVGIYFGADVEAGASIPATKTGVNYSVVTTPAETLLYGDSATAAWGKGVQRGGEVMWFGLTCLGAQGLAHGLHSHQANVSWLDGHAKSMRVDTSIQSAWKAVLSGSATQIQQCVDANVGDIIKGTPPAGIPPTWLNTTAAAPAAYYYLLQKP